MKEYRLNLYNVERTLPFIPIGDDEAFASFVILGDTELIGACAPELAEKIGKVDAIVTAEAKGIALADPYLYQGGRTVGGREKRGGNNAGGGGILL